MKRGTDYTGVSVVYICHDGQGNILFQKRSDRCRDEHHTWDTGGGGLEFNDTVEDTLRKEIKEEYGADVISFENLGWRDAHRTHDGKPTHWVALDFKVLVDPAEVVNGEPEKFDEIRWFPKDALPTPLHSQLPFFLEKHKDRL